MSNGCFITSDSPTNKCITCWSNWNIKFNTTCCAWTIFNFKNFLVVITTSTWINYNVCFVSCIFSKKINWFMNIWVDCNGVTSITNFCKCCWVNCCSWCISWIDLPSRRFTNIPSSNFTITRWVSWKCNLQTNTTYCCRCSSLTLWSNSVWHCGGRTNTFVVKCVRWSVCCCCVNCNCWSDSYLFCEWNCINNSVSIYKIN